MVSTVDDCHAAFSGEECNVRAWRRITASSGALAIGLAGLGLSSAPAGAQGLIELVSVDTSGTPMHKTESPTISDDGASIAFVGAADSARTLFASDRITGVTTEIYAGPTERALVAGDGQSAVFQSTYGPIYARDRGTSSGGGGVSVVSILPNGDEVRSGIDVSMHLGGVSDDGRFVTFSVRDVAYGINGVFVRDRDTSTTAQVNVGSAPGAEQFAAGPVSNDGGTVLFTAMVRPPNRSAELHSFAWTRSNDATEAVSVDSAETPAPGGGYATDMTPDGRFVAFQTTARLETADPNVGAYDVYVRDRAAQTTSFVGINFSDADAAYGDNTGAVMSDNARHVAYLTTALVGGKTTHAADAVVADRDTGTVEIVSLAFDGTPAGHVGSVEMTGDGRHLTFVSHAPDLVPAFDTSACAEADDYTECRNVYAVDRAATGAYAAPGGTVSDGETSVELPAGVSGPVNIAPAPAGSPVPSGYEILGEQVQIEAPVATWNNPLRLTFTVQATGVPASDIAVIRDGVLVADCIGSVEALPPDGAAADGHPCVASRTTNADGDAVLVVLTPHASVWTLAEQPEPQVTFDSLAAATRAAVTKTDIAESLCAKLAKAEAAIDSGDRAAADRALDGYRRQVRAQAGKAIAVDDATSLLTQSEQL